VILKTVILDDEPAICSELEFLLQKHIEIQIVSIHYNPVEALAKIIESEPDLLFLDIQMPEMNGLEFARKLNQMSHPPFIIFSTAYHEHALEAFNTPAIAYLTKPISESRLDDAIKKVKSLQAKTRAKMEKMPAMQQNRICIWKNGSIIPIHVSDISFAFVKDKELYISTKDLMERCDLSLNELEMILYQTGYFFRSHRNYMINLKCITEIIPWFNSTYLVKMNDAKGTKIPVSRGKMKEFRSMMNL
jgi:DNA-binding LytR/AlgR family response regulator